MYLTAHILRFVVEQLKQTAQFSGVKITTGGCFFYYLFTKFNLIGNYALNAFIAVS